MKGMREYYLRGDQSYENDSEKSEEKEEKAIDDMFGKDTREESSRNLLAN